jgi:hypothetical protein
MCWVDSFTSTTRWPRSQAVSGHDRSHIAGDMRLIDRSSKSLRGVASTSRFEGRIARALRQARRAPLSAHQYDGEVPNQTGIALSDRHFGALHLEELRNLLVSALNSPPSFAFASMRLEPKRLTFERPGRPPERTKHGQPPAAPDEAAAGSRSLRTRPVAGQLCDRDRGCRSWLVSTIAVTAL